MINAGAALFIYSFVFLEKDPVYQCSADSTGPKLFTDCSKEDYCDLPDD